MKLKKLASLLTPIALALSATTASADFIGVYTGAAYWSPSFGGEFRSEDSNTGMIDVDDDLSYSADPANSFYLAFEHPIPLLPNVRIERTNLAHSSDSTLSRTIEFNGKSYTQGSDINSNFDLTHTDWTAYYEFLDDTLWLSLDAGVTLRVFDGKVRIENEDLGLNVFTPMMYGKADVFIPGTDLSVGGMINYINIGDVIMADRRAYIAYESPFRVGAELGYRSFDFEIDSIDNLDADFSASGFYGAVTLHL